MKKTVLIFSGYNQRAIIAFLRTLEKKHLNYAIIANSKEDTIFSTVYAGKVLAVRNSQELNLNNMLSSVESINKKIKTDRFLIIPSSEALNRFILENKGAFEGIFCDIPLVENDLYEEISDKYKFNEICIKNGILTPGEFEDIAKENIPFAAKPREYFSTSGTALSPVLVKNIEDYNDFSNKFKKEDFYYQQFIGGKSFYLLYYFYKNGGVVKFSQENLVQQPCGKSVLACASSDLHEKDISLKYEKMLKSLNFFGLIMVEVKEYQGTYYMIEANPRLWGPSQLFVDAGVNFFESFLYDNGVLEDEPIFKYPKEQIRYFWLGGLMQSLGEENKYIAYHDYSPEVFIKELPSWIESEIYRREDTYKIFKEETKI